MPWRQHISLEYHCWPIHQERLKLTEKFVEQTSSVLSCSPCNSPRWQSFPRSGRDPGRKLCHSETRAQHFPGQMVQWHARWNSEFHTVNASAVYPTRWLALSVSFCRTASRCVIPTALESSLEHLLFLKWYVAISAVKFVFNHLIHNSFIHGVFR